MFANIRRTMNYIILALWLCCGMGCFPLMADEAVGKEEKADESTMVVEVNVENLEENGAEFEAGPAIDEILAEMKRQEYSVVVIKLNGPLYEAPVNYLFSMDETNEVGTDSLYKFTRLLRQLENDSDVDAVLFNLENPQIGWAHIDELRYHIEQIRKAGKKTYAYAETLTPMEYLLACHCDEVVMTPAGNVFLPGLGGQALYFKDLLDKIGVKGDYIQVGRYKSAAESITRSGPSESELEQMNSLLDALFEHLLTSVAYSRGYTRTEIREIVDQGFFTAGQAEEFGLINKVMYRKEFIESLEEKMEKEMVLDLRYAEPEPVELELDNPFAVFNVFQQMVATPVEPLGDAIAIVYLDGPIVPGESQETWSSRMVGSRTIRMALAEAARDRDVKAVVVRINSPGGSATASDIIYEAIRETAEEKPVIVSMGSVAASGGYYIACGAPTIYAQPSTITGSIGVIGGKLVLGGLFDKIGVTSHHFKRGKNALLFNMTEPFTANERNVLSTILEDTYETFKDRVAATRKSRLTGDIDELAQGRVYSGKQALQIGLVDKLGGLSEAVMMAAEEAGIEDYHIQVLPRPKNFFEIVNDLLASDETSQPGRAALSGLPGELMRLVQMLPYQPAQKVLVRSGIFYHLIEREKCITMMPFDIMLGSSPLMNY